MQTTHTLKCLIVFFQPKWDKCKTFEIRKNDRNYKVNDKIKIRECYYSEGECIYTGRYVIEVITYVLHGATQYGLMHGYCILSTRLLLFDIQKPSK